MSRPLRIEFPGAVYHVTSRGNERKDIFRDDVDRQIFLDLLGRCVQRYGWIVTAYVLMSNHYHLVIELTSATLSRGLHWLNGTYTQGFNKRHRRAGHLFQGRPHTPIIDKESYLLTVLRYVVLNPVRASMVPTPGEHFWSSYRSTAGLAPAPDWLRVDVALSPFCPDTTVAQAMYQDFVYAGIGLSARPWDELVGGIYLGSEPWLEKVRQRVESAPRDYEHPRPQRYVGKPAMPEVVRAVAESVNLDEDRVRLGRGGFPRMLAAWLGCYEGQHTLSTIAASLRLRNAAHVSRLVRECDQELSRDQARQAIRNRCIEALRAVGITSER